MHQPQPFILHFMHLAEPSAIFVNMRPYRIKVGSGKPGQAGRPLLRLISRKAPGAIARGSGHRPLFAALAKRAEFALRKTTLTRKITANMKGGNTSVRLLLEAPNQTRRNPEQCNGITMKLTIENLGPIERAEIELADLTIICGENNTGKTYITYLVYCLMRSLHSFVEVDLGDALLALTRDGVVRIDLEQNFVKHWDVICAAAGKKFLAKFPALIASKSERFSKLQIKLDIPLGLAWKEREFNKNMSSASGKLLVSMSKPANSAQLEVAGLFSEPAEIPSMPVLADFIKRHILALMLEQALPSAFIASTERTGLMVFRKHLKPKPDDGVVSGYEFALPVLENVDFINRLPSGNVEDGALCRSAPQLLQRFESVVGGTYVTNDDGISSFSPKGSKLALGLGEASSSVRSLLVIWYWLKHNAQPGDMLMIDEPELNLHPANQRRLARFLAALVNHGVKVFVTTHSDYLIREFNTLIMLNQDAPALAGIMTQFKDYQADDKLAHDKVCLYMTRDDALATENENTTRIGTARTSLARAVVTSSMGIEAQCFDETIDEMNEIHEAIYYGIN